jgi:hypothetical protein
MRNKTYGMHVINEDALICAEIFSFTQTPFVYGYILAQKWGMKKTKYL